MTRGTVLAVGLAALAACMPRMMSGSYSDAVTLEAGKWWSKSYTVSDRQMMSATFSVRGGAVNAYFLSAEEFNRWRGGADGSSIKLVGSSLSASTGQVGGAVDAGTYVLAFFNPGTAGAVTVDYTGTMKPVYAK
jgi:hypothetical protein